MAHTHSCNFVPKDFVVLYTASAVFDSVINAGSQMSEFGTDPTFRAYLEIPQLCKWQICPDNRSARSEG